MFVFVDFVDVIKCLIFCQAEVDVLYAKVNPISNDGTDKLQTMCDQVFFIFLSDKTLKQYFSWKKSL